MVGAQDELVFDGRSFILNADGKNKLLAKMFKQEILDFTFAYRLYPKKALKGYKIKELRHGFALEILLSPIRKGYKVITLPAKWKKRVEGRSSITIHSYFSYLKVLYRII